MLDDNYHVNLTIHRANNTGTGGFNEASGLGTITNSTIYIDCYQQANQEILWEVKGYSA